MMYDKDFMNVYSTSCTLFKNLYDTYITEICRKKLVIEGYKWLKNENYVI